MTAIRILSSWLVLAFAVLSLACTNAVAETEVRYITDQVRLRMYEALDLKNVVNVLKSGQRVEVLETNDSYTKIRTDDDQTGWVKTSYLITTEPAQVRLTSIEEEKLLLQKELEELRSAHTDLLIEQPQTPVVVDDNLKQELAEVKQARAKAEQRISELEEEQARIVTELRSAKRIQNQQASKESRALLVWLVIPALTLLVGFFLGFKFMEKRIRARFGGLSPL